jgi:hypothetical protein
VDGIPQVIFNYARVSRGPWRIAAFIDFDAHPATSRFLVVRPRILDHSLFFLWAALNSPVANAFSKAFSSKRDILVGTMRQLPLPLPSDIQLREIESAAHAYLEACTAVRATHVGKRRSRASVTDTQELPGLSDIKEDAPESADFIHLRDLHWRMDAAVLRLYNLPPELERQLLDYFAGHARERVPFAQTEYMPKRFTAINTLDELLALTVDWPIHNERRSLLIDKEYQGTISREELSELNRLQKQTSLRRQLLAPYPIDELEGEIARLKREGKWE